MTFAKHQFESPDSTQTLAEGLAEYFAVNPMLKRDSDLLSAEARHFFRSHDAVHIVYGCGTTMPDEAIVKLVSIFGTTGGLAVLRGYLHHETLDIYRKLSVSETLVAIVVSPFLIARTIWRCVHQSKRWPWAQFDQYFNVSLREVRAQFRIKVGAKRNAA